MKPLVLGIAVLALFCACAWTKSPEVSLSGGDGSSFAKAIVVKAPTDESFFNVPFLEHAADDGAVCFYQNYQPVSVLAGVYRLRLAAPVSQPFLRSP